jgi:hypothetical protein
MTGLTEVKRESISARRSNPSIEHLLGDLVSYRHTLVLLEERFKNAPDPENKKRVQFCMEKLDEAEAAITKAKLFKKVFLSWDLLHQVSEELILLLNPAELSAEGEKLALDLKLSSLPESVQAGWISKINDVLKKLTQPNPADNDIRCAQQTIKMALNTLNSQTDSLFWDIWTKKLSSLIYTVLLTVGIFLFVYLYSQPLGFRLSISNVLLLGAIGGVASGIMTAEPQYIAKGHFWVSTLYYTLVRPTQGALAAMVVFWMLQSQYLIKIEPPLSRTSVAFSCFSCPQNPTQTDEAKTTDKNEVKKNSNTLIILNAAKHQEIYLYLLILLMAGFSGDKILKTVSDRTFSKLFTDADKYKEAK